MSNDAQIDKNQRLRNKIFCYVMFSYSEFHLNFFQHSGPHNPQLSLRVMPSGPVLVEHQRPPGESTTVHAW